jgi:hypothetical protein
VLYDLEQSDAGLHPTRIVMEEAMETPGRIAPAEPPFAADVQSVLERIMPEGAAPLVLFTTLAKNPRVFRRFMAGGLLDKGSIGLREREIMIDRTTARCGSEYEWGVHVKFFAEKAELTQDQSVPRPRAAPMKRSGAGATRLS